MSLVLVEMIWHLPIAQFAVSTLSHCFLFFFLDSFVCWFDLDEGETLRLWKFRTFLSACLWDISFLRPAPFLCFTGATTSWCSRKCWPDTSCWALHWLQNQHVTDVPSFTWNFTVFSMTHSVVDHISIFWKRDIFWKTYYSSFFSANSAFRFVLFLSRCLPYYQKCLFLFFLLGFITSPKRLSILQLPFHIFFESFSIKEQPFAFLSPLLFCTI